jgi:simple sugar transport system permease protein
MVGENPAAADASGINVSLYKYVHIIVGGFLCGLGGAYLSVVFITRWQVSLTAGLGWIAVALVIFCTWNPLLAILGGYFFGGLRSLGLMLQNTEMTFLGFSLNLNPQFLDTLPYLITVVVLVLISIRNKKENQPPAWLSLPYYREER